MEIPSNTNTSRFNIDQKSAIRIKDYQIIEQKSTPQINMDIKTFRSPKNTHPTTTNVQSINSSYDSKRKQQTVRFRRSAEKNDLNEYERRTFLKSKGYKKKSGGPEFKHP